MQQLLLATDDDLPIVFRNDFLTRVKMLTNDPTDVSQDPLGIEETGDLNSNGITRATWDRHDSRQEGESFEITLISRGGVCQLYRELASIDGCHAAAEIAERFLMRNGALGSPAIGSSKDR